MGWYASWATEILLWTKYLMTSTLFAGWSSLVTLVMTRWWEWWLLQRCNQERLAKPTDHQTSPNFTIRMDLRLLQNKNFFLSFPLHLTQIALKTIKISNITFSDFQHIWYIYHNIFSILVCFSRLSLSLLLSSFQLSTVTFDLGTINLGLWTQKYENWFWKEWTNLNHEVVICKN